MKLRCIKMYNSKFPEWNFGFCLKLLLAIALLTTCQKKDEIRPIQTVIIKNPIIATIMPDSITQTTSTCGVHIISTGGSKIIFQGVCWREQKHPLITLPTVIKSSNLADTGTFFCKLTNLKSGTKYFVRSFAANRKDTFVYGNEDSFVTSLIPIIKKPKLTTNVVISITQTTAISGGDIYDTGSSKIKIAGICWSTGNNPTVSIQTVVTTNSISAKGSFMCNMSGLSPGIVYFARSFAINNHDTAYGNQMQFTTLALPMIEPPIVMTNRVSSITQSTAICGGHISNNGGAKITLCGVCWDINTTPVLTMPSVAKTTSITDTGSFSFTMKPLKTGMTYYVRAFAANSKDTAYGNEVKFATLVSKSSAKTIESFIFNGLAFPSSCIIDSTSSPKTIRISLPPGANPTGLIPVVTISDKARISPASGVAQDFTNTITYTVTAEDSSTQTYVTSIYPTIPSTKDKPSPPQMLCIYYAWPSAVNGSNGDVNNAVKEFSKFDIIVLGDKIWQTTHGDNSKTKQIISGLKNAKPSIKIYGYIDVGVSTQNLTETQLKDAIDGWNAMGVTGVFGDDFGYDYNVNRSRQNVFIDYAHGLSLSVFTNAWAVSDALSGSDCHLGSTDFYLLESWLIGNGSYRSLTEFKERGDAAYYYMKTKGIGIATLSTTATSAISSSSNSSDQFTQSWYGSAMYNFDAYQFTDGNHSSSNNTVYAFPNLFASYGSSWKQADWIQEIATDKYLRSTDIYTFYLTGDGYSTGSGYSSKP